MQKQPITNHAKNRNSNAAANSTAKQKRKDVLYIQGKKITGKLLNIFNYQYKDSDLEQFVY
jgi:hypothetical protein